MKKKVLILGVLSIFLGMNFQAIAGATIAVGPDTITQTNAEQLIIDLDVTNLPSYFSWRDINGVDFTTDIRSQIPYPSCEAFGITAAIETMVQYKVGYPFGCDLSEAHLYFNCNGSQLDWGTFPESDLRYLQKYGIPDEACWPYPKKKALYPPNTSSPDWQNRTVKITNWSYLPSNIDAIKNALITNGPVPSYLNIYEDFMSYGGGIYRHIWGESVAVHIITIVGYNDNPGYWICKNSWGKAWGGENGWFKIKYGECSIEELPIYIEDVYGRFPIVYVDDSNTMGPWNGTKEYPYETIKEGIDNVYEHWAVYVKNGTYHENIAINKSIQLDGENKTNTIIDGNHTGGIIRIEDAPNTRISGFTIQNSGDKLKYDAGIDIESLNSNATIINNIIKNNHIGIRLEYTYPESTNTIKNNIITSNYDGIYVIWAYNNNIENNMIENNIDNGIKMERSEGSTIKRNMISDNGGCGIYMRAASNNNKLELNTIKNNSIGFKLEDSNKNKIQKNNFINNQKQATFINSFLNKWQRNYWDDWHRFIPRPIHGKIFKINWLNFDLRPSKQLY
jgi:parallel beta-helix repeat protein